MSNFNQWLFLIVLLADSTAHAQTAPFQRTPSGEPDAQKISIAASSAGTVNLVEGDVHVVSSESRSRIPKVGEGVSEGDLLITGKDGEIHLTMEDSGFIALRPNTQFKIDSYKADGEDDDKAIFRLLVGGFRSVTGWIGKYNPHAYQVRTATATIGIRGTDHEPHYIPEGSSEGEPGTYDKVYVGGTVIENSGGTTAVAPTQAGFVPLKGRDRPRLLAGVPSFFRASRYEPLIAKKHAEIQRTIAARREQRRKIVIEKRKALVGTRAQTQLLKEHNKVATEARQAAAQAHRKEAQEVRHALQRDSRSAQELQKDVQEQRKALQAAGAGVLVPNLALRTQRKALRDAKKAALEKRREVRAGRATLHAETKAAAEERQKEAHEQRETMTDQRKTLQGKRKDLQNERQDMRHELKDLREQEQQRYRGELKAAAETR